jgi:hypothetical protein
MNKTFVSILMLLSFCSCIKEVPISDIPFEKKLVIGCIANPDSTFHVNIRSSQLINATSDEFVENAIVKLFKDNIYIDSLHYEQSGWYRSSMFPVAESEYELRVSAPEFIYEASAKTFVPAETIINRCTHTLNKLVETDLGPTETIELNFYDPIVTEDFYELVGRTQDINDATFSTLESPNSTDTKDPSILSDGNIEYSPSTLYFSDKLFNGTSKDMIFGDGDPNSSGAEFIPTYYLYLHLRKTSPSYYYYLRSWTVHRFNQNTDFNTKEPLTLLFQGDPVELYTNVENGYGIFGAYNEVVVQAQFVP